jgi:hypothetical protein
MLYSQVITEHGYIVQGKWGDDCQVSVAGDLYKSVGEQHEHKT